MQDQKLYSQLIKYPREMIPIIDMAANNVFAKLIKPDVPEFQIQVRSLHSMSTMSYCDIRSARST